MKYFHEGENEFLHPKVQQILRFKEIEALITCGLAKKPFVARYPN